MYYNTTFMLLFMKKNQENKVDEEFDLLLQKFIDDALDDDDLDDDLDDDNVGDFDDGDDVLETDASDEHEEPAELRLPFPREMDDRVAEIRMKTCLEEHHDMDDVQSVSIELMPGLEKPLCCSGPVSVTIQMKPKARARVHRFKCFVYHESFFPMCASTEKTPVKRLRDRRMIVELPCDHIWVPGKYILYVNDSFDESLMRIDFTLDSDLRLEAQEPRMIDPCGLEHVLVSCIEVVDDDWQAVAEMPGVTQFRQRVMQARQMVLMNEVRKELRAGTLRQCHNLIICTHNDDITPEALKSFQRSMIYDHGFVHVDCSTLYEPTSQYPYEQLSEKFSGSYGQVYCLTHIADLLAASGKVVMHRIMENIRASNGQDYLWICGLRSEIDELLELYPSLRQSFEADSYVEQQRYSPFDLVQVFFQGFAREHLDMDDHLKDRLAKTILQGCEQGAIANWTVADVRRFIADEVRPRYIQRIIPLTNDYKVFPLCDDDIPFTRITETASLFQESIRELNEMIGLDNVKKGVMTMANQARFAQERRQRGLKSNSGIVYHTVFVGNPGTGKTTVARQLGRMYHALGLLSKGELIAVDRTRLVGQYLGQTEDNMKVIFEEARGNVLFIDEAYNLSTGSDDRKDFGYRVIESLLTVLTRPNPDMLVVLAGYTKEMNAMLKSNPGLWSRFPYRYQFDDYSAPQLMEIARHLFESEDYILTDEAATELQKSIEKTLKMKLPEFGNARWIEQLVHNGIIPAMADRFYTTGSADYQHVEASDITKAFETFCPKAAPLKPHHKVVSGFSA